MKKQKEQKEQYMTPIAESILSNLPLMEEVIDILETIKDSKYGIADIIQDNVELIDGIREGIRKLYFKGITESDINLLGVTTMYFCEITKISQNIIIGVGVNEDTSDFTLTHGKALTDELLKTYVYKAFACYILFIHSLIAHMDENTQNSVASKEEYIDTIEAFLEYVNDNEEWLKKYHNINIEKEENFTFFEEDEESTEVATPLSMEEVGWATQKAKRVVSRMDIVQEDN